MKKGVTLIELAIVLVVIGSLLGLAFKGKELVESARLKADMNKIHKIATAISVYLSSNNKLPGEKTDGNYSEKQLFQDLIDEGSLTDKDLQMATLDQYFHLLPCKYFESPSGDKAFWAPIKTGGTKQIFPKTANICITASTVPAYDNMNFDWTNKAQATQAFVCYVENQLDDKNLYSGDGRSYKDEGTKVEVSDCKKATGNKGLVSYYYRVF